MSKPRRLAFLIAEVKASMKAVILAGGLGVRLHPLTKVIPKPLLPIGEKAVLEIQIERLKEFGVEDIFLAQPTTSPATSRSFSGPACPRA